MNINPTYHPICKTAQWLSCAILAVLLFMGPPSQAQIKIGENATIGGRIGLDISYYKRLNKEDSRDPFRIRVTAQPYFKIKDWTIRTNIMVGDYHKKYAQEFNKFGTSIEFREILKLHAGHFNVNITPMTLQGHTILGGGVEINPNGRQGIFRFAAMYGRFRRDINPTEFSDVFAKASYNRWGLAGKIGFGKEHNFVDLIILRVGDTQSSLAADDAGTVTPAENGILSIHTKQRIWKMLELEGELALSAFTNDLRENDDDESNFTLAKVPGYFISRNASSEYAMAIRASLSWKNNRRTKETGPVKMNGFTVALTYDRIDPDYQSMGTYYTRNDLQRVKLTSQMRFFNGNLTVAPQAGWETTDLDERRTAKTNRFLGGLNTTLRIKKNTFLNLSYMNFNNALESNVVDSLISRKINHNIQGGIQNRHETKKGSKNSFRLNVGYQLGKNKSDEVDETYLGSINLRTSYTAIIIDKVFELSPSFRLNSYDRTTSHQFRITPGIAARINFLESKMNLNIGSSAIITTMKTSGISGTSIRNDFRWNYRFVKKQSLSVRIGYQQNLLREVSNFGDFRGDLRYVINL